MIHWRGSEASKILSGLFNRESGYIRECYVGLAHIAPPTNINFWITFLLIRLLEALYEDLPVQKIKFEVYHHFSGLSFIAEVNFWCPLKKVVSCDLFIIGRAKRAPHWGVQSRFRVIFIRLITPVSV